LRPAPRLKKQTISQRRKRRAEQENDLEVSAQKILLNRLKLQGIESQKLKLGKRKRKDTESKQPRKKKKLKNNINSNVEVQDMENNDIEILKKIDNSSIDPSQNMHTPPIDLDFEPFPYDDNLILDNDNNDDLNTSDTHDNSLAEDGNVKKINDSIDEDLSNNCDFFASNGGFYEDPDAYALEDDDARHMRLDLRKNHHCLQKNHNY
jgi:hypothetical protein